MKLNPAKKLSVDPFKPKVCICRLTSQIKFEYQFDWVKIRLCQVFLFVSIV